MAFEQQGIFKIDIGCFWDFNNGLIVCHLLIFVLCFGSFNSELCELPPVTGPCRAAFPRWYYNSTAGKCLEFTYGGCMGNANNFDTDSNCTKTCAPSVVAQKGLC